MAEVGLVAFEGPKIGGKTEHLQRQLGGECCVDLVSPTGIIAFRQEYVQQWSPEVVGRARVVEPEHVRAGPYARRRVLDIWKMRTHHWRHGVFIEGCAQLEPW